MWTGSVVFERIAVIDSGGAATRCVQTIQTMGTMGTRPRTVLVHRGSWVPGPISRGVDEVTLVRGRGRDLSVRRGRAVDVTVVGAWLERAEVDAVWVGWGAPREHLAIATACEAAGVTFAGPAAAALRTLGDPEAFAAHMDVAGVPIASAADRSSPRSIVEVQLLVDRRGRVWTVGRVVHTLDDDSRRVFSNAAGDTLEPQQDVSCQRMATAAVRVLELHGAVTVELTPPRCDDGPRIRDVRPHITPTHVLAELMTGLDIVACQFGLAAGNHLTGDPPTRPGSAASATLRLDGLPLDSAETTVVERLDTPFFPGLRCDRAAEEGDEIPAVPGTELVTFSTTGPAPARASARLARAIAHATVLLARGATNRAILLDGLREHGGVPSALPNAAERLAVALVVAAIEVDDDATADDRVRFLASAARGRPHTQTPDARMVDLQVTGRRYRGHIRCMEPLTYALMIDGRRIVARVEPQRGPHRTVHIAGRRYSLVSTVQGADRILDVAGEPVRVTSLQDGTVRAPRPAIVMQLTVRAGDQVATGDPLAVLETMKLETVLSAPFAGQIEELYVSTNDQVDTGGEVLRIQPLEPDRAGDTPSLRADLSLLVAPPRDMDAQEMRLGELRRLRYLVLGFDRPEDHRTAASVPALTGPPVEAAPTDQAVVQAELEVLRIFADLSSLTRNRRSPDERGTAGRPSEDESLRTYLRTLDADTEHLPDSFRDRLLRALSHLGVESLERTAELEVALHRMHLAHRRAPSHVPDVLALLDRWLRQRGAPEGETAAALRDTLDHLVRATEVRYPAVGDLARRVRYRLFDQPRLTREREHVYEEVRSRLLAVASERDPDRRATDMAALVAVGQPLLPMLLDQVITGPMMLPLLEVLTRRYYGRKQLDQVRTVEAAGRRVVVADLRARDRQERIVAAAGDDWGELLAVTRVLADDSADASGGLALDAYLTWRDAPAERGTMVAALLPRLRAEAASALQRVTVAIVTERGTPNGAPRIQQLTFRRGDAGWSERRHLRGIHPLVADRLAMWRFDRFELTRMASSDDVYLLQGIARENPADVRLFALAEVRDLTMTRDDHGEITALPELERVLVACLDDLRHARAGLASRRRPDWNRVVLDIWPAVAIPTDQLDALIGALAPLSTGLGLEEVTIMVRTPDPDGRAIRRCLRLRPTPGQGMALRITKPPRRPLRPLDELASRVLHARRRGTIHPSELLPLLVRAPDGSRSRDPPGGFEEHDLDATGGLRPVVREPGKNTSGIVVGVVTSPTKRYPDGLVRVALLSDATRSSGSLAEPECRRILAAIDLAEDLGVPVEWFAMSTGARIAMDSGTENLDWTSRVLRRIVVFTQNGGEINVVVTGINVGAQPYWNAEATMLMHTRGIVVMTPESSMVLTGKRALDHSGSVSAEDDIGIGGYERIMGPNGQATYWAPDLSGACTVLFRHYDLTYIAPGEPAPRRALSDDPHDRDVCAYPHQVDGIDFATVGDIFDERTNPDRKKPFDIRTIMRAVADQDVPPLERWRDMANADNAVVFDAQLGGHPIALLGIESRPLQRHGSVPADGPGRWTAGTLFPQSSKKLARAINAASGGRPLVVLANLSGFDGSPESLRERQLEYGAEIGRAVVNFHGPMVFCVIARYHGGAFVVFSKTLNDRMQVLAVEGARASVIGGAPAAAVVFSGEVDARMASDPRVIALRDRLAVVEEQELVAVRVELDRMIAIVRAETLGKVAAEFDAVHDIHRAVAVGSVDHIVAANELRPQLIAAIEYGLTNLGEGDLS